MTHWPAVEPKSIRAWPILAVCRVSSGTYERADDDCDEKTNGETECKSNRKERVKVALGKIRCDLKGN